MHSFPSPIDLVILWREILQISQKISLNAIFVLKKKYLLDTASPNRICLC